MGYASGDDVFDHLKNYGTCMGSRTSESGTVKGLLLKYGECMDGTSNSCTMNKAPINYGDGKGWKW